MKAMRPIRTFFFLLLSLFSLQSHALPDIMRIGLFYDEEVKAVEVVVQDGSFRLFADGKGMGRFRPGRRIKVEHLDSTTMRIHAPSGISTTCEKGRLERLTEDASFRLQRKHPFPVDRNYPGELTLLAKGGRLQVINRVAMAPYLSGVVLAEAGSGHHPEFYKVQAIICRTYALHNLQKFRDRGIHLCDKVACQVYEGMNAEEPMIDSAVKATEGIVLVDEDIELITAAYHSNSGGRTAASEMAWSKALPYLRPIDDPFSKGGRHYQWRKAFPKEDWLNYLEDEFGYPVEERFFREHATSYCPDVRMRSFAPFGDSISLQKIRRDLKLNSTFFHIRCKADSVIFEGRGFGHGVGLSQEGAMRMADLGVPFDEIIQFYYQGVHLVKIEALDFFRDGG